jgi:hypothetical protein
MARSTRIKSGAIEVEGLAQLSRALKELGPDFSRELRLTNKSVADMVADDARAAAYSIGGVAAHVAPGIKSTAGIRSAGVSFGGSAYPMAGGAEFGSIKYPQFAPYRGSGSDAGYFVYPSIREDASEIADKYIDAVNVVIERNFPY